MDNMTLLIDPETRDLVFDEDGNFKKIYAGVVHTAPAGEDFCNEGDSL